MNKNNVNKDFYVLEYASKPGVFYVDNWNGYTDDVLRAEHYDSPEEALEYWEDPSMWKVCKVHLDIQHV